MVDIGDAGKRINAEYGININTICPLEFYNKLYDEINERRSKLINELNDNVPDSLRLK